MPRTASRDSTDPSADVAIETEIEAEIAGVRAEAKAKVKAYQKTLKWTKNTQKMAEIVPKSLKIVKKQSFLAVLAFIVMQALLIKRIEANMKVLGDRKETYIGESLLVRCLNVLTHDHRCKS